MNEFIWNEWRMGDHRHLVSTPRNINEFPSWMTQSTLSFQFRLKHLAGNRTSILSRSLQSILLNGSFWMDKWRIECCQLSISDSASSIIGAGDSIVIGSDGVQSKPVAISLIELALRIKADHLCCGSSTEMPSASLESIRINHLMASATSESFNTWINSMELDNWISIQIQWISYRENQYETYYLSENARASLSILEHPKQGQSSLIPLRLAQQDFMSAVKEPMIRFRDSEASRSISNNQLFAFLLSQSA